MTNNCPGDDLFLNRLLFYLQKYSSIPVQSIFSLKGRVYKIETPEYPIILKGFRSYHRVKIQRMFTESLKDRGFTNTAFFLDILDEPLLFENIYYDCLRYIPSKEHSFSYMYNHDRLSGLDLLRQFHHTTGCLAREFSHHLRQFNLLKKWRHRTGRFFKNIPIIHYFIQKEILEEILTWADWSLKGLEQTLPLKEGADVILHGDVADHNFIRGRDENLYLIDFDLISIGLPIWDYLQYAHRILPHLCWSLASLQKNAIFSELLKEKVFVFALAYPADIFREWNRVIRKQQISDMEKLRPLLYLTVEQFKERKQFFTELQSLVRC